MIAKMAWTARAGSTQGTSLQAIAMAVKVQVQLQLQLQGYRTIRSGILYKETGRRPTCFGK